MSFLGLQEMKNLFGDLTGEFETQNAIVIVTQHTLCKCTKFKKFLVNYEGPASTIAYLNINNVDWIKNWKAEDIFGCSNYNPNANHKYYLNFIQISFVMKGSNDQIIAVHSICHHHSDSLVFTSYS